MGSSTGVVRRACGAAGALGVAAGCTGMVAMLPAAATSVLGVIGITGSSALARTLSPVAEPLFIASAALIAIGALACSRLVTLLAVGGSALLYLSMFQLAAGQFQSRVAARVARPKDWNGRSRLKRQLACAKLPGLEPRRSPSPATGPISSG